MLKPERISILFAIILCLFGLWMMNSFMPAILWATILAITTWPMHRYIVTFVLNPRLAAILSTSIVGFIIGTVLIGFIVRISYDFNELWSLVIQKSSIGIPAPSFLHNIPTVGRKLYFWWQHNLSSPNGLIEFLQSTLKLNPEDMLSKIPDIGVTLLDRGLLFLLTLLILFFIYSSGDDWVKQLNSKGTILLGAPWVRYINKVAPAIRATMNGLFLVGIIEAIGLGIAFYIADVPSYMLLATFIGLCSIIPGMAFLVFAGVLFYLWYYGTTFGFIMVLIVGFVLLGIFDSIARPFFIGNSIKLPFLPIFLSILGGFQTLGLLGIFLGPTIFVMLRTLWEDIDLFKSLD